ncbi:MAG: hypothetical protein LBK00_06510 [Treponema sp.]|jgi:hypothetical protein|nr:hypothetical protein [Treponema sp.]
MNITAKVWCALFVAACLLAMAIIIGTNYILDPYGYFLNTHYGQSGQEPISVRNAKIRYIKENPDVYTGFIIGGSRTGALDPALASEYTGLSFYNFCFPFGYQEDYEMLVDLIIAHTQARHIILQLNGQEIQERGRESKGVEHLYALDGKASSKVAELTTVLLYAPIRKLLNFILKKPEYIPRVQSNGMIEYIGQYNPTEAASLGFVEKTITPVFQSLYQRIFLEKTAADFPMREFFFESLLRVREKCAMNDIKLTVLLAPSSVYVLAETESPLYWDYLRNMAAITGFYNFNGYSPYNFNPYNFVDSAHYRKEMGDKILRVIFNQEEAIDDWGVLASKSTIDAYLERRKSRYFTLKKSYEETGAIPLGTMNDASFIPLKITRSDAL